MPKVNTFEIYRPEQSFLAIPDHYLNVVGFIEFPDLASLAQTDESGKYAIKSGTVVNIDAYGRVTKPAGNGNGIIFNSIEHIEELTEKDWHINATVLIHGFVRRDRLFLGIDLNSSLIYAVNK